DNDNRPDALEAALNSGRVPGTNGEAPHNVYSAKALELYMRCPRQYYYSRVLTLGRNREGTAYAAFHKCVWSTITWWKEQLAAGVGPTVEELQERLNSEWQARGPDPAHPHEAILRLRAEDILK